MAPTLAPSFLLLACALLLAGCDAHGQAPDRSAAAHEARPVLVRGIAYERSTPDRSFVGTIRPRIESDLGFRIAGKVARRLVNVGDVVKAGTPLATLDEVDLRLQMEQAGAEVATARVAVTQADADLSRTTSLAAKGWTAQATVDRQRAVTEEARSRLLRAERALDLAKNGFAYAVLLADAEGAVTATAVEPGQVVSPGQMAVRLAHTAEREAVVAIPEAFVARAREGAARVALWSSEGTPYPARLRELAPAADLATRTFLARFSIPSADERVRLGMTATVTLTAPGAEEVARVPMSAIYDDGHGPSLWSVVADGRLALRPVTVVRYDGADALLRGVAAGTRVVSLGVHKLDAGQRVRAVDALSF